MLFYCAGFTFLFISSSLLTVIALPEYEEELTNAPKKEHQVLAERAPSKHRSPKPGSERVHTPAAPSQTAATQTTMVTVRTDETDVKQLRSFHELNTMKIEAPDSRQPTQVPKYSSATSPGEEDEEEEEEDSGYEEMVSYRSCQVSDTTYRHREQIPRSDPCEICVCVDSEMYCLWKMCSHQMSTSQTAPATTTTAKTPVEEIAKYNKTENQTGEANPKINEVEDKNEKFTDILTRERKYNAMKKLEVTSPKSAAGVPTTTTEKPASSSPEPTVCYVMGVMYKLGEVLPRDTGTCLECSCSEGARVTCRPKDCVSQQDLDYLNHNNNLDMFDLDSF